MRVYVAVTMELLSSALASGHLSAEVAYAVTPSLREWYVEGDAEELEYAAMTSAARASLQQLAACADGRARRVVLAFDVPDEGARPAPEVERAAVRLRSYPLLSDVVSAHVDDAAAEADVRAAVAALSAAARGDADAEFIVEAVEDHELAWYAAQEIPALLAVES